MARILSGKEVAKAMDEATVKRADNLRVRGGAPTIAVIRVGSSPEALAYEKGILSRGKTLRMRIKQEIIEEADEQSFEKLSAIIRRLNSDADIHGILLFRPLPAVCREEELLEMIAPEKDVDGVTAASAAGVFLGNDIGYPPCTADAVMRILEYDGVDLTGKKAVVVGRSTVIGRPVAMMLMRKNATVTICHTRTKDLAEETRQADVLVVCAGKAGMITEKYLRQPASCEDSGEDAIGQGEASNGNGQIVIDVGINATPEGKLVGDCVAGDLDRIAKAYTPVPGGVGSVTVSVLMAHTVEACARQFSGRQAGAGI